MYRVQSLIGAVALAAAMPAMAVTWTGTDGASPNWSTGTNWQWGNEPAHWDDADFGGAAAFPIVIDGNAAVSNLNFSTAGWTINGTGGGNLDAWGQVNSSGMGTNILNVNTTGFQAFNVGAGNTFVFSGTHKALFTKSGPGTMVMTGSWQVTSTTSDVHAGSLLVNGAVTDLKQTGWAPTRVHAGARLGGTGSIAFNGAYGEKTLFVDGMLAPGGDGGSYGSKLSSFTITGGDFQQANIAFSPTAALEIALAAANGSSGRLVISGGGYGGGANDWGSGTLALTGPAEGVAVGNSYEFARFAGFGSENGQAAVQSTGSFAHITYNGMPADELFSIAYNVADGQDTKFVVTAIAAVPEPVSIGLVGMAGLTLLRRRRA